MTSNLSTHGLHDAAQMGMRVAVGVIFIVHGFGKFGNPETLALGFFESLPLRARAERHRHKNICDVMIHFLCTQNDVG